FYDCKKITSLTIPSSVTSIEQFAFYGCDGLESIVVNENNNYYDSRNNCNALIETSSNTLLQGCRNSTIPDGIVTIGENAFCYIKSLTSIVIPNSVTTISKGAFQYCNKLETITIGNGVTSIGETAFGNCASIKEIILPENLTSISKWAFSYCTKLEKVTIGTNITDIYEGAFYNCKELDDVYYKGNEQQWSNINILYNNNDLTSSTIHYNS
ncbi:MAG: leucine-rich repeat domain-containing protein, partial [Bacilli bacterium]|nr:leucine-rich repeat domain-containing protein [Bacilli bacterium]